VHCQRCSSIPLDPGYYSFCVQPFSCTATLGLILRDRAFSVSKLVRAGGWGTALFITMSSAEISFSYRILSHFHLEDVEPSRKPSKRPSGSRIAEDFGSRRDVVATEVSRPFGPAAADASATGLTLLLRTPFALRSFISSSTKSVAGRLFGIQSCSSRRHHASGTAMDPRTWLPGGMSYAATIVKRHTEGRLHHRRHTTTVALSKRL